jgi:hypothetical protein
LGITVPTPLPALTEQRDFCGIEKTMKVNLGIGE